GSGKTAAFAIPAVEKVDPMRKQVQVLILCPTRELAVQVSEEVHKLCFFKRGIHALPIYGGQSYERQYFGLKQGAQIVIGTPGRVMDHMRRGTLRLDNVKMMILDEADVMLNMGFREDIEFILQSVPVERQTVFFSATMPRPIQDLIQKFSKDPQQVKIEQKAMTVPTVDQCYYEVDRRFKIELLTRLIDIHDLKLGIVFCNTKAMVDDLVDHLNAQGYSADRLHGDMSQMMRDRVMNKFRKSGLEFLVATDVAARGIDVDDVQVVFNYDLPYDPEDYVHRIGRTGRAGRSGRAITFASGREVFQIRNIERFTNMRIQRAKVPTLIEVEEARDNVFLGRLRTTLQGGEFKRQDHLIERLLEEGFSSTDIASALLHQLQGGEAAASAAKAPSRTDGPENRQERGGYSREPAERRAPRDFPQREVRSSEYVPPVRREIPARPAAPFAPRVAASAPVTKPFNTAPKPVVVTKKPEPVVSSAEPSVAPRAEPASPASVPAPAPVAEKKPTPYSRPTIAAKPVVPKPAPAPAPDAVSTGPVSDADPKPVAAPKRPVVFPVKREKLPPWKKMQAAVEKKVSRRTPENQTRLHVNIGEEMGVKPGDIVGAILGETGLPADVVGVVDVRERHLFVDVAAEHANAIISKLSRSQIRGRNVKIKTV
ncbi:MAG TPA: DEAD/DEAH box helicase, partial [Roseimicrobium sp.]|nr:DEAD/DEAH box helicase [Roseimicrobium sp.]